MGAPPEPVADTLLNMWFWVGIALVVVFFGLARPHGLIMAILLAVAADHSRETHFLPQFNAKGFMETAIERADAKALRRQDRRPQLSGRQQECTNARSDFILSSALVAVTEAKVAG